MNYNKLEKLIVTFFLAFMVLLLIAAFISGETF